jgi:hypothetical protein
MILFYRLPYMGFKNPVKDGILVEKNCKLNESLRWDEIFCQDQHDKAGLVKK